MGKNSSARAINVAGDVIGEIDSPNTDGHATLWQNGNARDIGTLPGMNMSTGTALNNRGQAVGTSSGEPKSSLSLFLSYLRRLRGLNAVTGGRSQESAWVYRDGKMSDLNALIPRRSGWTLETATGINDRGQIVGKGLRDGHERAFLLTPR